MIRCTFVGHPSEIILRENKPYYNGELKKKTIEY